MAVKSSSHARGPARTCKKGTASTNSHRFETFNEKISKIKIDPVRQASKPHASDGGPEPSGSYFESGLLHWSEQNLSRNFAAFVQDVTPLCDGLPQLLHHQDRIFTTLIEYIELQDALSLQPLLVLLSQLAHDLGVRFEPHFPAALSAVLRIAAHHQSVEAIEWAFACIAWLFKYLAKLLVPDIWPTYCLLAPLLGKGTKKEHVARFAAEALSFLVRKASLVYTKDPDPLNKLLSKVYADVRNHTSEGDGDSLYRYGVSTLLLEAVKGADARFHSCAQNLFRGLISSVTEPSDLQLLLGVLTGMIHYADASAFEPILGVIFAYVDSAFATSKCTALQLLVASNLLFYVSAARKGTRVHDWSLVAASVRKLQRANCKASAAGQNLETVVIAKAAAAMYATAPIGVLTERLQATLKGLMVEGAPSSFLTFCVLLSDLNRERYDSLVAPYFYKYLCSHWQTGETLVLTAVPLVSDLRSSGSQTCPAGLQEQILASFQPTAGSADHVACRDAYLDFIKIFPLDRSQDQKLLSLLRAHLERLITTCESNQSHDDADLRLYLGAGLQKLLNASDGSFKLPSAYKLFSAFSSLMTWSPFLRNLLNHNIEVPDMTNVSQMELLFDALIRNLKSADRELRRLSLKLLSKASSQTAIGLSDLLLVAISIEDLPLDFKSARQGSMLIRSLSGLYQKSIESLWARRAAAYLCFGILTLKFSPWWTEAIEVLKTVCENRDGERIVEDIVFEWLDTQSAEPTAEHDSNTLQQHACRQVGSFESSDIVQIETLMQQTLSQLEDADQTLKTRFGEKYSSNVSQWNRHRSQALLVLNGLPNLAEKKSRRLAPFFLDWVNRKSDRTVTATDKPEESGGASKDAGSPTADPWTRTDGIAILNLFGVFQNPTVLYKSSEVFGALLDCLTRPDAEVQRAAFKAIRTWKNDIIALYHQNILNLIDEARFRDELTTLLSSAGDETVLRPEHFDAVLPIMLRVLYGKAITRSRDSGGATRRKAIFNSIFSLPNKYVGDFLEIALDPLKSIDCCDASNWGPSSLNIRPRTMLGLVNLVKDLVSSMGERVAFLGRKVFGAVLFCSIRASELLESARLKGVDLPQEHTLKAVRQIGIQCISLSFDHFPLKEVESLVGQLFERILAPRIEMLPLENAHSVSGLLRLFAIWASKPETVALLDGYGIPLLAHIFPIVNVPSAKDEVKLFVLDAIIKPMASLVQDPSAGSVASNILRPRLASILDNVAALVGNSPSPAVLASTVELASMLAALASTSVHGQNLLRISACLIDQPRQRVGIQSKSQMLAIVKRALQFADLKPNSHLLSRIYCSVSAQFNYFLDRDNRLRLCEVMSTISSIDVSLEKIAIFCSDVNAFSTEVLDEPNFGKRIEAFSSIAAAADELSSEAWRPLLYNCLFYIKNEDVSLRTSASFALHRFVDARSPHGQKGSPGELNSDEVTAILLDQVRLNASSSSEALRTEMLSLMAHMVKLNPSWSEVNDMHPLLMGGDEEASIFNNILHIQRHRRLRALRRLATEAQHRCLGSKNITKFWIPLLEPFVLDKAEGSAEHNLASESVATIAALAAGMQWPQLRSMLKRYTGYIRTKRESEKQVLRMLAALIDTLAHEARWIADALVMEVQNETTTTKEPSMLGSSLPAREEFGTEIERILLPPLRSYLYEKDESTVVLRAPVAISIVKLLKILSPPKFEALLPPVLTDLSHILRSRAQESRDLTRTALVEISQLIGAERFGFVLKELRGSLRHGYQRHVLSFTVHSILVATAQQWGPGDLDHCLSELATVIMDDIFGSVGQEKDTEEYVSKMKEVKKSKSFDSMELVAKIASVDRISHLIRPLQSVLEADIDAKMARKVDELLRRMGAGLLQNPSIQEKPTLMLCYEILHQNQESEAQNTKRPGTSNGSKTLLLQPSGIKRGFAPLSRSAHGYQLARFALDLLRTVLARHEELRTPSNLSGFLPVIGDLLLNAREEVRTATLRLLVEVLKTPFADIRATAELYATGAIKTIKDAVSTSAEIAQAAIKLITTILRERHDVCIREIDLAYLIKRVKSDLQEPDRQGVTFNFLKAVLQRKIVITEVYEVMDVIASIMITSHAGHTRNTARSLYLQFLMNYPQAKVRLSKQFAFLVKNLEYKHVEGRQSVMEIVHLLLGKVGQDVSQDMIGTFFLPVVLVAANDESVECRKMAGSLLKSMFEKADDEQARQLLTVVDGWLGDDSRQLSQMALRVYTMLLDAESVKARQKVSLLLAHTTRTLRAAKEEKATSNWEAVYYALNLAIKICERVPTVAFDLSQSELWASVEPCLKYHHAWVKLAASQLIGQLFADTARNVGAFDEIHSSRRGSCRLLVSAVDLLRITRSSLRALQVSGVSEELATQLVRNVIFVCRLGGQQPMHDLSRETEAPSDDEISEDEEDRLQTDDDDVQLSPADRPRPSWLLSIVKSCSFILRREPLTSRAASLVPKKAALQLLAALCNNLPASSLEPHLAAILMPLHHLTDASVTAPFSLDEGFKQGREGLAATAQESMALLQAQVGPEAYVRALADVQDAVRARREGRRVKRRIEVVAEPEKIGREKRRKEERQKQRRKERVAEFRERRRGHR